MSIQPENEQTLNQILEPISDVSQMSFPDFLDLIRAVKGEIDGFTKLTSMEMSEWRAIRHKGSIRIGECIRSWLEANLDKHEEADSEESYAVRVYAALVDYLITLGKTEEFLGSEIVALSPRLTANHLDSIGGRAMTFYWFACEARRDWVYGADMPKSKSFYWDVYYGFDALICRC